MVKSAKAHHFEKYPLEGGELLGNRRLQEAGDLPYEPFT